MKKNKENAVTGEKEDEKKSGVGILLKEERERRGYSIDEIANIIKIRRQFIDAIESESWEKLPSSVFIKGFLRSYAKALKIDIKEVLDLYRSKKVPKEEKPRPLVEPEKSKKKFVLVIFILLCLLVYTLYYWVHSNPTVVDPKQTMSTEEISEVVTNSEDSTPDVNKQGMITEGIKDRDYERENDPEFEKADKSVQEPEVVESENKAVEYPVIPDVLELEESVSIPLNEVNTEKTDTTPRLNETSHRLLLTGIVKMRTYVKIYIDDNPPKEYMFRPGSRPQWEARKGFDILVGNAAGIEFDFNGELKKNLGGLGKVVRISLPEDFKAGFYEE